jgi:geranylgeranyl reductase family protein
VWDVIVVGGGPAGAAAGLAAVRAAPGARVLLLDKTAFPRDKACGDGIAPHALAELAALGVPDAARGYKPIERIRVRAPRGAQAVAAATTGEHRIHVVPRYVFDARLVEAARDAGVEVRVARLRSLRQTPEEVQLNEGALRARVVVAADGANSTARRLLGLQPNPPAALAIAVRGYAPAPPGPPEQAILMVEQGWPAYAWSFAIGDGTANVGYGLLRARLHGGREVLHARLAALLPGQPADPATLRAHHLPFSSARPAPGRGRVLLAGDAASLINPLTGEGIYYAVASGRRAGEAAVLAANEPSQAYTRALRSLLARHLRQTTLLARTIRHRPFVDAAVRAADRHSGVFDDLVELGLGAGRLRPSSLAWVAGAYLRG